MSLDNIRMNVVETSTNGVVKEETVFVFSQTNDQVHAEYAGGRIAKGFLVGKIRNGELHFSYCQLQMDGRLDNGISTCILSTSPEGKITLTEHFEWKSRPGEVGTNVFQEIRT
jgi:hypothetical protein